MYERTDDFERDYPGMCDEISEACWRGESTDTVKLLEFVRTDAINCYGIAVLPDQCMVDFENGDRNGFVVHDYGIEDCRVRKQYQTVYRFAAKNDKHPNPKLVETFLRREDVVKKQGEMNYDLFFSPTDKIWRHYKEWADAKGLKIKREAVEIPRI